ncbi:ABC transporter ATP-binding protein [Geodermatophilus sp. YIM 151500]|uniref:ABC transporter ATP-binding protein n=1 Tax=Geodermatophilus sp. YIM 151500 TaxID=2984531 RepID=UPI0021E4F24B|nr:ABC transporter ATP-binding protein [Geodermatophilus sp. YIM 151500]MCV2488874.1 ABC transporter ATP-binding protein [Geodermatophilus sp. YIM 151500]
MSAVPREGSAPPRTALLELQDVQAYYGLAHVLQGVSLGVRPGELVALLGRNGAGKTTTVKSIMGMVSVRGGSVRCDGRDVVGLPAEDVAQFGIGYVPEDRRMFPGLSVRENFRLAAIGARLPRGEQQDAQRRALEVFPQLEAHLDRDASRLSGGQQQMVAVGRALIGGRRLLLVDEITQGLAPNIAADLGRTLRHVADEGLGVLLVEQNSQMALELADQVYVIDQGVIVHSGDARELRADQSWMEQYLQL